MFDAYYAGRTHNPVKVESERQLISVMDVVAALAGPQIVHLMDKTDPGGPDLMVGLHGDRGTLRFADARNAYYSSGGSFPLPDYGEIVYYLGTTDFDYPDDAEIPVTDVRDAARAFLTSGGQCPGGITWTRE